MQLQHTLLMAHSMVAESKQTADTYPNDGGGGVCAYYDCTVTIRESTLKQNEAPLTGNGHQIMIYKMTSVHPVASVTIVNTRFVSCDACGTGANFFLYDNDNTGSSGTIAYGSYSRKLCSSSPCTVAPFTGSCTDRTDNADYGVTCAYSCGSGTYGPAVSQSSLPPLATCTTWSSCTAGEYISSNGTNITDRVCTSCSAGTFSTSTNENSCTPWVNCTVGQYIATNGASIADRVCTPCGTGAYSASANGDSCTPWANCTVGQYIATNGTSGTNRGCSPCDTGKYSTYANAFSCTAWSSCVAGQKIAANGTATTDRTCVACSTGKFSIATNQNTCTNWTACNATTEVESSAGSATADRVCATASSPSPAGSSPSPAGSSPSLESSPSTAANTSTTDVPNLLSAASRYRPQLYLCGVFMVSILFLGIQC